MSHPTGRFLQVLKNDAALFIDDVSQEGIPRPLVCSLVYDGTAGNQAVFQGECHNKSGTLVIKRGCRVQLEESL